MKSSETSFKSFLILLFILFAFGVGCEKDSSDTPETTADISGFWIIEETATSNCSGSTETELKISIMSIDQSNSTLNITWYPNEDEVTGTLSGNKITWSGSIPSGSGTTSIDFNGVLAENEISATGTANWTWSSLTYQCSGTSNIVCEKASSAELNFAGLWEGTWEDEDGFIDGTFSANVTQSGSTLSGTISVPEVGISDAELAGQVNGNIVFFGDIDGIIKFVGILDGNSTSGSFIETYYDVDGGWNGTRQ